METLSFAFAKLKASVLHELSVVVTDPLIEFVEIRHALIDFYTSPSSSFDADKQEYLLRLFELENSSKLKIAHIYASVKHRGLTDFRTKLYGFKVFNDDVRYFFRNFVLKFLLSYLSTFWEDKNLLEHW